MPNNWSITLIILSCNLLITYNYFPIIYFWDIFKEDDLGKNVSKTGKCDLKKYLMIIMAYGLKFQWKISWMAIIIQSIIKE